MNWHGSESWAVVAAGWPGPTAFGAARARKTESRPPGPMAGLATGSPRPRRPDCKTPGWASPASDHGLHQKAQDRKPKRQE